MECLQSHFRDHAGGIIVNDINRLRRSRASGKAFYWLQIMAAVIWVAGAYYSASNGNVAIALFLLGPVPFAVVSAAQIEQSRVNRALLAEIDALRSELAGQSKT
jgi:hypothetical protein